ncbi:MAG: FapA family protein [Oscillospiraceae bacterium]|nr:FapA family protein [Oscillospiraceae bacterium]
MTNMNVTPKNAEALISISANRLEALIRITPPENGGADLSYAALKILLAKNRIIFGLDDAVIKSLSEYPVYGKDMPVARGIPSIPGTDAELIYHIETNRQIKPKEKEDGSVDFKDLGTIQNISKDYLLCEKTAATPGKNGTDVTGTVIKAVPGKDLALPGGKNTVLSEDKLKLYSAVDGHAAFTGGKINILDTFIVKGSISVETGNIDFSGNILVCGDVAQGYSLRATGDITVEGVVEAAQVTAGGNLVIRGGFLGGESGALYAGQNAVCRFIEGGQITAIGDVETTYIMNAKVNCGGKVNLIGKGLIRGGSISARKSVTAAYLGSPRAALAATVIEVGGNPLLPENPETTEPSTDQPPESERGTINVKNTAYTGLKLIMGNESLILQTEHDRVSFYKDNEGIAFTPLIK